MSRLDRAYRGRRDIAQIQERTIATIAAGSANDPATDFNIAWLPDPRQFYIPSAAGQGIQAYLPLNRMELRCFVFLSEATTGVTIANATNYSDYRLQLYRLGVLQGVLFFFSQQVTTTLGGTGSTAGGAIQTITPASMNAIVPGVQLYIDRAGTNPERVTVLSTTATTFNAYFRFTHTSAATVETDLVPNLPIYFASCYAVQPGATLPAIGSAGSQAVTPNAVNGLSGMYGIHVGDSLLVDTVASGKQETVLVTAVSKTQFTATFANTHASSAPISTTGAAGLSGTPSANNPYEIREDDVLAFARVSSNATGLATPPGIMGWDWDSSHWR